MSKTKNIKRFGVTGIIISVAAVIVCKLPILLALLGFSGLTLASSSFSLPAMGKLVVITFGLLGFVLLTCLFIYRVAKVRA